MSTETTKNTERNCPVCGKTIYYGIYCSNECSDIGFQMWKAENPEKVGNTTTARF